MNYYYRGIPSQQMSDFEEFYRTLAHNMGPHAWFAELGIASGRSVILMASLMSYMGKPCHIWAVDNFSYGGDDQRKEVKEHIENSGETTIEVRDQDSLVASCQCQDEQFDCVFIDSSHLYENTKAEIRLWLHKVKTGGYLAGHDYLDNEEVRKAVDELIPPEHLVTQITTAGHGVWYCMKTPDLKLLK